jgi:hypothetical protein
MSTTQPNKPLRRRQNAARQALSQTPGTQRQQALQAYMGRFHHSVEAEWTLVCEAIAQPEANPVLTVKDLHHSGAVSYQRLVELVLTSITNPGNPLRNVGFIDMAVQMKESALCELLRLKHASALASSDPIEKARFMFDFGNLAQAAKWAGPQIKAEMRRLGVVCPSARPELFVPTAFYEYLIDGRQTSANERILLATVCALPLPAELTVGRKAHVHFTPSEGGDPYLDLTASLAPSVTPAPVHA